MSVKDARPWMDNDGVDDGDDDGDDSDDADDSDEDARVPCGTSSPLHATSTRGGAKTTISRPTFSQTF